MDQHCLDLALRVLDACRDRGVMLASAESCTGGLIAACLTEHAGASQVFERGFVTYSNEAKVALVGVREASLAAHGAVSERVAREMAEGALERAGVALAVAVTGIAGPGGATAGKPVGLVHLACARRAGPTLHVRHLLAGTRAQIRTAATAAALTLVLEALEAPVTA